MRGVSHRHMARTAPPGRCTHLYEAAIGYWDKHHESPTEAVAPAWDPHRSWVWRTFDERCPVANLLSVAAGPPDAAPDWFPSGRALNIVFVGDSLDKHIMQAFCELNTTRTNLKWLVDENSGAGICRGAALTVSNFRIFGLARPSQNHLLRRYESREPSSLYWDTHYRLHRLLKRDLPDSESLDAIVLHSGVWDLSRPTTKTDPVSIKYLMEYRKAVHNISRLVHKRFPHAKVFWRTGPPTGYRDAKPRPALVTRTKKSQVALHNALKDAVDLDFTAGKVDGHVLDWFNMLVGWSHLTDTENKIHYPPVVNLAFLNLVLNVLREHIVAPVVTKARYVKHKDTNE